MSKVEHIFHTDNESRSYAESSLNLLNSWTCKSCQLSLKAGEQAVAAFGKILDRNESIYQRKRLVTALRSDRNLSGKAGIDLANVLQDVFKTGGIKAVDAFIMLLNKALDSDGLRISHREDLRLSNSVNQFAQEEHLGVSATTVILQLHTETSTSNKLLALLSVKIA